MESSEIRQAASADRAEGRGANQKDGFQPPVVNDPGLNAAKLQRLLGMSRSSLHRKLKAATGMSATAYIRYLRLHKAAQLLLEQPEACILGIALEVGFNNHSYFTKRFREVFGVCPGEYRERSGDLGHLC